MKEESPTDTGVKKLQKTESGWSRSNHLRDQRAYYRKSHLEKKDDSTLAHWKSTGIRIFQ